VHLVNGSIAQPEPVPNPVRCEAIPGRGRGFTRESACSDATKQVADVGPLAWHLLESPARGEYQ